MAKNTPEAKLEYIMQVLKHTDLPRPDFNAIAKETGHSSANNAQKKFKAIIESAGFKLENNQIIDPTGDATGQAAGSGSASTPRGRKTASTRSTPRTRGKPTPKSKASTKKRNFEDADLDDNESDGSVQSQYGKRARTGQHEVKQEREDGDDADDIEIVSEGVVGGGARARSMTIKADPLKTDSEDDAV